MFDIWSLQHFASGIAMAFVADLLTVKVFGKFELSPASRKLLGFFLVIIFALFWECVEHYLETGLISGAFGARVTHWFQGVEHWSNRLIGDTLAVILGWYVFNRNKYLAIPAKIFSVLWMGVNIFIFPDSMYLQRFLTW